MCGTKYVPLSELAQQSEEVKLIPLRSIQSGGYKGGKHYDIFFTNKRIVVLAVFIPKFKDATYFGPDQDGMTLYGNLQGKIGSAEVKAWESYKTISLDEAPEKDPENSYQVPYETLQSLKVSGRFMHTMEIKSQDKNQKFGLDPVDFSCLLGALPQIPALAGKLQLSER